MDHLDEPLFKEGLEGLRAYRCHGFLYAVSMRVVIKMLDVDERSLLRFRETTHASNTTSAISDSVVTISGRAPALLIRMASPRHPCWAIALASKAQPLA